MDVIDTLRQVADRLQVGMMIGSVPGDGSGHIELLHANPVAAMIFGYPSPDALKGADVRTLMPQTIARDHRDNVAAYVKRANGGGIRQSSVMGQWRSLEAVRMDGSRVPVSVNVADVRNTAERYFVAIVRDRSESVAREAELAQAVEEARRLAEEAEEARTAAEDGLLRQKRLSGQISLLKQIYTGTIGLVVLLGVLTVASWATGAKDPDSLAMFERVLLVLTGMLGSALAAVFDTRRGDGD